MIPLQARCGPEGRGIALLFHDRGTRRGWVVSSTPRSQFTPGKDPVPILQEAGWALGPVWTGGRSRPHRDSIPDRPARSPVAISTELPGPHLWKYTSYITYETTVIAIRNFWMKATIYGPQRSSRVTNSNLKKQLATGFQAFAAKQLRTAPFWVIT